MRYFFYLLLFFAHSSPLFAVDKEIVIDAVLASVDGKPITLQDLCEKFNKPCPSEISGLTSDFEARQLLDSLILERLVEEEANTRKLSVRDEDIDSYVDEVAKRNQLSREAFEGALQKEGKNIKHYKEQVRLEILKSKLANQLLQSGIGATKDEIDDYIKSHPELEKSGSKIKLRQIFISNEARPTEAAHTLITQIREKFASGEDFARLASQYSEAIDAQEGGLIGVVSQEDLNSELFDTLFPLQEGEASAPVEGVEGFRIFYVEKRFVDDAHTKEALYDEVRRLIEKEKLGSKLQDFFATELSKLHQVDKKI